MKNEKIIQAPGLIILASIMLLGLLFVANARSRILFNEKAQEEAKKPAEISLILIAPPDCERCVDGNALLQSIEKENVHIIKSETFLSDSEEGQLFIEKYGIVRVPSLLVDGEYKKENVSEMFDSFSGIEQENTLVIQASQPVYVDLSQNAIIGLVDITYLTDLSCKDCYDPTNHKSILTSNFGIAVNEEITIDANSKEGRALIAKYNITETPSVLLSDEAIAYPKLTDAWISVGSIEDDGTFVFRQNEALGTLVYKNIETGEIIRPITSNE